MVVVVPLGTVMALRRVGLRVEQARRIVVVLEHEMNLASALRREPADRHTQLMQQRRLARRDDGVDGIEP